MRAGIYAASLTPLRDDLTIDHAAYAAHVRWLFQHGCDGVVLMGTTGEATSFGIAERQEALERILAAGLPAGRLMVGTGCAALSDTVALTRHALASGLTSVLVLPPFYYKNPSEDGLFASIDLLAQRVGDARLQIYLYHFPQMSAVPFSNALIERLIVTYPKTVVGLKDSSGDLSHMQDVLGHFPGFRLFAGTERYLLEVLRKGGAGCISATVNVTCRLVRAVYQGRQTGVDPAALQQMKTLRGALESRPVIPTLKWIMSQLTGRTGWQNVLPPHIPMQAADAADLAAVVQQVARSLRNGKVLNE